MLWPFKKAARPEPEKLAVPIARVMDNVTMRRAEWHAFHSMQLEAAGDPSEAREHLKDAGEFLAQMGGPSRPKSAEEIYQWCAARRALEV